MSNKLTKVTFRCGLGQDKNFCLSLYCRTQLIVGNQEAKIIFQFASRLKTEFNDSIKNTELGHMRGLLWKQVKRIFFSKHYLVYSDGIQGVRTGSCEPVLGMPGKSANLFLLFVIDIRPLL